MWTLDQITVEIEEHDDGVMLAVVTTPAGIVEILASVSLVGRTLYLKRAHVDGPGRGALGRAGLNSVGQKLLEEADADEGVIEGSTRSTGRNEGGNPRPIRFRRR